MGRLCVKGKTKYDYIGFAGVASESHSQSSGKIFNVKERISLLDEK